MKKKGKPFSFEKKLGAGFLATILAAITICLIALYGLNETIKASHIVISDFAQDLILAGRLGVEEESRVAAARGFLITGDRMYLHKMEQSRKTYLDYLMRLRKSNASFDHDQLLSEIGKADESYEQALSQFIQSKLSGARLKNLSLNFEEQLQPKREDLQKTVNKYIDYATGQLENERKRFSASNKSIFHLVLAVSLIALALAGALSVVITKTIASLYRKIQGVAKVREEIVEMVAHDLRNPVAAVTLATQVLQKIAKSKDIITSAELLRRTEGIMKASGRINSLIDGLLDLAKTKAGTLYIEKASVSPKAILADTFDLFDNIARQKKITLEVQNEDLPFIQCDYERLVQVFSNLVGNAIKFSISNQKIIFGARPNDDSVIFFVTDEGPGIPKEEQAHVFERYWQTGNNKRAGVGLGLAICKGIVAAHGGKIWLKSKLGSGTTFYFSIPICNPALRPISRQEITYQKI